MIGSPLAGTLAPLGVAGTRAAPTFDFALAATTFTAAMAKRNAPGPFTAAPIVQGPITSLAGQTGDQLAFDRGTQIAGAFFANIDTNQGSLVCWLTPEWNGNDGRHHLLFYSNSAFNLLKNASSSLVFTFASAKSVSVDVSSWVAGTAYCVVCRWDSRTPLDGTNYACVSVSDVHTFGSSTTAVLTNPSVGNYIGSQQGPHPAAAIIEGLTVYRRVLYDGTYGVNVGNGDELALIYNSNTGRDPTTITGSWDVVFALPTNSSTGALATGTGEAWSHPHSSNLVTAADGFMTSTAWNTWTTVGSPTNPALLATNQKIFAGGYSFQATGAGDGYKFVKAVSAGNDFVIRGLAHSDGTGQPKLILWDESNGAEIGSLTGTTTSTRVAPDVFVFCGEAPAGCTSISVRCVNAAASGVTYWHQVEVLANLVTNPSFASGSGTPWIPTGWTNGAGATAFVAGELVQETVDTHSGGSALKMVNPGGTRVVSDSWTPVVGSYYCIGFWNKRLSGAAAASVDQNDSYIMLQATVSTDVQWGAAGATWIHQTAVGRCISAVSAAFRFFANVSFTGQNAIDDAYTFALTAVSLSVTPASAANSDEASGRRVDGRDTLTQPITTITTTRGKVRWDWSPRHSAADAVKFLETSNARIAVLFANSNNRIGLYWTSANTLRLDYSLNGTTGSGDWTATGAIIAGTTYTLEIEYTGGGTITLKVDGTTRITLSAIPAAFAAAPTTAYWGSDSSNASQGDATFAAPTP